MTVDGKVTTRAHTPVDFTSRDDKLRLITERALADAVLVGHTTLARDNVRLGIPRAELRAERIARGQAAYPVRVIVSNRGRINPALNVFQADYGPILIFSTTRMPATIKKSLAAKATLHLSKSDAVDLARMLLQLRADYGIRRVACEGGPILFRSLLELQLIDQLNVTIAPFLFGGETAPTLTGTGREFFPHGVRCSLTKMETVGQECFLTYKLKRKR